MQIRQLFDHNSSSYTYLLWDESTREGAIIDSVTEQVERDQKLIAELELDLKYALETHIHADHVTGSGALRERLGCRIGIHANAGNACADLQLVGKDRVYLGSQHLEVIYTPGHTNTDISYKTADSLFTGDILLVRGSGRTDFQDGDAGLSYDSITGKIFTLPGETVIYPAHDYNGFCCSTVAEERRFNPRLGSGKTRDEYIQIMESMKLDRPSQMDAAVPANLTCGL